MGLKFALVTSMRLIALLFLFISINSPASSLMCVNLFDERYQKLSLESENDILNALSQIETEILFIVEKTNSNRELAILSQKELAQLESSFEMTYNLVGTETLTESNRKIEKLKRQVDELNSKYDSFFIAKKLSTIEQLADNPNLVLPKKVYKSEVEGRMPLAVSFSERVINDVFLSKSDLRKQAVKASLRAIMKGLIPNFSKGTNGIKITEPRELIFEIVIVGQAIGQFRLLGYIDEKGIYRVVHFYENSDHSNHIRMKQVEIVLKRKFNGEI